MENIYRQFALDGLPISCARYGSGHINETYLLVTSRPHLYILQKINSYVFHNAAGLMDNIIAVTDALRRQDPDPRHVLTLVPTLEGRPYLTVGEGETWRLYEFVTDSLCLDKPESVDDLKQSGVAFGMFQNQLADFPAHTLTETIPISTTRPRAMSSSSRPCGRTGPAGWRKCAPSWTSIWRASRMPPR